MIRGLKKKNISKTTALYHTVDLHNIKVLLSEY